MAGVRRKDTTKGPPLRILSLDGGGVRGYSMLVILQELMHRTFVEIEGRAPRRHEIPKPCDHFDLIVGTGTGGLIAIMLGRLRLDIDTCKDVYVRMTKRVFETDKTFAGIPYRSTLFKASKLEEAVREVAKEHTIFEDEGNDEYSDAVDLTSPSTSAPRSPSMRFSIGSRPGRTMSSSSRYSQYGTSPIEPPRSSGPTRWGNANALLYDSREHRTKTGVTAVYKGTPANTPAILLRSYDSRKETAPELHCTVWQAARATAAVGLAFKPIQIGQSVFIDEGNGKYNPAPLVLDEAVVNEWPSREVGVFISIGTGKRPPGTGARQHEWWEGFVGGTVGDFAEARRRLMAKIEACETTHQQMLKEYLPKRGVPPENYFRLNVEVGVGEFGMNEWNRLADISTSTRMYLARQDVQDMNISASAKLAKIHRATIRHERLRRGEAMPDPAARWNLSPNQQDGLAVELPAEDVKIYPRITAAEAMRHPSIADEKFAVISSDEFPQPVPPNMTPRPRPQQDPSHLTCSPASARAQPGRNAFAQPSAYTDPHATSANRPLSGFSDKEYVLAPSGYSSEYSANNSPRVSAEVQRPMHSQTASYDHSQPPQNQSQQQSSQGQGQYRQHITSAMRAGSISGRSGTTSGRSTPPPPPLPPKAPLRENSYSANDGMSNHPASIHSATHSTVSAAGLPYPDEDGPPPVVNFGTKPTGVR